MTSTVTLVHARPATDPVQLHLAMLGDRLSEAAISEDMMQTLISAADLGRMVRSLRPDQAAAAEQAAALVAKVLHILETALAKGQAAARHDQRQSAYAVLAAR